MVLALHLHVHLRYLADAFIQSDLQSCWEGEEVNKETEEVDAQEAAEDEKAVEEEEEEEAKEIDKETEDVDAGETQRKKKKQ